LENSMTESYSLPFGCRQAHGWFLAVVWTLE
jgi:hypothetical protein